MLTLFIANKNLSSWSLRAWVLLKALDIPFQESLETYAADGKTYEKFKQFSPTGLVPCLKDGDILVWDTLAISEYIAESYPNAWPKDKVARAWARSASAEMHSGFQALRSQCPMNCHPQAPKTDIDDALQKDLQRIVQLWEQGLNQFGGPFLVGDHFTVVDALFAPVAIRITSYQLPVSPGCQAWIDHMMNLPAMQQWITEAQAEG